MYIYSLCTPSYVLEWSLFLSLHFCNRLACIQFVEFSTFSIKCMADRPVGLDKKVVKMGKTRWRRFFFFNRCIWGSRLRIQQSVTSTSVHFFSSSEKPFFDQKKFVIAHKIVHISRLSRPIWKNQSAFSLLHSKEHFAALQSSIWPLKSWEKWKIEVRWTSFFQIISKWLNFRTNVTKRFL